MNLRLKIIGIIVVTIIGVAAWYYTIKPSCIPEDINIRALAMPVADANMKYKDIMVEFEVDKGKEGEGILYPYSKGLDTAGFTDNEPDKYFIPNGIGMDGYTEEIAIARFKEEGLIYEPESADLIGFRLDNDEGKYYVRMYYNKNEYYDENKVGGVVYVFTEEKYGKKLSWSKYYPMEFEE